MSKEDVELWPDQIDLKVSGDDLEDKIIMVIDKIRLLKNINVYGGGGYGRPRLVNEGLVARIGGAITAEKNVHLKGDLGAVFIFPGYKGGGAFVEKGGYILKFGFWNYDYIVPKLDKQDSFKRWSKSDSDKVMSDKYLCLMKSKTYYLMDNGLVLYISKPVLGKDYPKDEVRNILLMVFEEIIKWK